MPDQGKVAQQGVLALEEVTRDDGRHRRCGRGGEATNCPAHALSVSGR
jgi:hypothetical protein